MSELRVVLMHLVDLAWFDVELWESEVTLLKNVFLVKLWNTLQIRPLPSIKHNLSKVRFVLNCSLS